MRVRYGVYESNEEMLAKVLTGNSRLGRRLPQQLPDPSDARERAACAAPARVAPESCSTWTHAFQRSRLGPAICSWCVPYMWGASGHRLRSAIVVRRPRLVGSVAAGVRNRITMLDDPAEVLGACLKKLGYSDQFGRERGIGASADEARRQKPLVRAYLNAEVRDQLVSGDILAAQLWATTSQQAIDAAPRLEFVYPSEGFALYADNAVILRESSRSDWRMHFWITCCGRELRRT